MLHTAGRIISLQVGMPQRLDDKNSADRSHGAWYTSIFKQSVSGFVWLSRLNLEGDEQADLRVHGGPDKAVLAYSAEHYPDWRSELNLPEFSFGAFGENFTVAEATEDHICIGDVHQVGDAIIQVAQPRSPCWKLARKWDRPDLPKRVVKSGRSGWYYRVLQEGSVETGSDFKLLERPSPKWPVRRVTNVAYGISLLPGDRKALLDCDLLAPEWK